MKTTIIKQDFDYKKSVNYKHDFYNPPITITVKKNKYILSAGSSDEITVKQFKNDKNIYIITYNYHLTYISLTVINPIEKTIIDCFLSESELNNSENFCYNVQDMSINKQIKILSEYLY